MLTLDIVGNKTRLNVASPTYWKDNYAKPLNFKISNDENQEALTWRNTLLKQVKSYADNNFNPA